MFILKIGTTIDIDRHHKFVAAILGLWQPSLICQVKFSMALCNPLLYVMNTRVDNDK